VTDPTITDPDKYRVVFENERVRVLEYADSPGERTSPHEHPDSVMITLSAFDRRLVGAGGESREVTLAPGDVRWLDAQTHSGENIGATPTHVFFVELKEGGVDREGLDARSRMAPVTGLESELDALASEKAFSGVVRVDRGGTVELAKAYGLAHRGYEIANDVDTRFALASGTKGLTALTVASLIEDGRLELATTARSLLGPDLPLIGDDVTVEHLLAHRSGIGDYLDEESEVDLSDYLLSVPAHELATTEQYLAVLDGFPPKFAAGERFAYCNSGYVVLALLAERASGTPFHELVRMRVCERAGMHDTDFLRSDELPGRTALGYLEVDGSLRTNVFHLPVRGSGDGGIYSTVADIHALWGALFAGRLVSRELLGELVRPRSDVPSEGKRYGLGFWLGASSGAVILEGMDTGVSFRSVHDPRSGLTHTVISNTTDGAWPVTAFLAERLGV
jgi:CubicO group peptidase (beta-lactamase class C family)